MGLGCSGISAARMLKACEIEVWVWDDHPKSRKQAAVEHSLTLQDLGREDILKDLGLLIVSPGIPDDNHVAVLAQKVNVPITGDLDLLGYTKQKTARYLGVTGTNGKSTTTAAIGDILKKYAQIPVTVGGNIGTPVCDLEYPEKGWYVLEASSFQLDRLSQLRFDIAIFLNMTPDHLDRHGNMEQYMNAKKRIFMCGETSQTAIISLDDPRCRSLYEDLLQKKHWHTLPISGQHRVDKGVGVENGVLIDTREWISHEKDSLDLSKSPTFFAPHFWQNAAAAYAATTQIGIAPSDARQGLLTFKGLQHRLSTIAYIRGIRYVNDSKATNIEAASLALRCFQSVYWIAGGKCEHEKKKFLDRLEPLKETLSCIRKVYLIGDSAAYFGIWMEQHHVTYQQCDKLECAFTQATDDALKDELSDACILLAPGCKSFDQYDNFEARGQHFMSLVKQLQENGTQKHCHLDWTSPQAKA